MFAGSRLEFSRKSVLHDSEAAFCIQNTKKSSPYLTQGPFCLFPERSPAIGGLQAYVQARKKTVTYVETCQTVFLGN